MKNDSDLTGMTASVIVPNDAIPSMRVPEAIVIEAQFTHGGADAMAELVTSRHVRQRDLVDRVVIQKWKRMGCPSEPIVLNREDFAGA